MTASSVTSVSLRPPLLLVSLAKQSRTLAAIRARRSFGVSLLRDDQRRSEPDHVVVRFLAQQALFLEGFTEPAGTTSGRISPSWACSFLMDSGGVQVGSLIFSTIFVAPKGEFQSIRPMLMG